MVSNLRGKDCVHESQSLQNVLVSISGAVLHRQHVYPCRYTHTTKFWTWHIKLNVVSEHTDHQHENAILPHKPRMFLTTFELIEGPRS